MGVKAKVGLDFSSPKSDEKEYQEFCKSSDCNNNGICVQSTTTKNKHCICNMDYVGATCGVPSDSRRHQTTQNASVWGKIYDFFTKDFYFNLFLMIGIMVIID